MSKLSTRWPELPFAEWSDTRETLHRWTQVLGKIRLALTPLINHWWNVPLQVTPRGLGTSLMSCGDRWLDMELDFFDDVLRIRISDGTVATVRLGARPVADFYEDTMAALRQAKIELSIRPIPSEIEDLTPLDRDTQRRSYEKEYVMRFWRIVARATSLLTRFRAEFIGKSSEPELYWGHLDLGISRFSGRRAPALVADAIEREAYSHELFGAGWWAGDHRLEKSAFYAYAAPEPPGFSAAEISTPHAYYHPALRGFYLDYDDMRRASDPDALLLEFLSSTYAAAARLGGWDRGALERSPEGVVR